AGRRPPADRGRPGRQPWRRPGDGARATGRRGADARVRGAPGGGVSQPVRGAGRRDAPPGRELEAGGVHQRGDRGPTGLRPEDGREQAEVDPPEMGAGVMREPEATVDGDPTVAEFERIVKVCDGFEAQWRRGERPRIEEFLARNPSLPRPFLFRELLALELELARSEGKTV